MKTNIKRIDTLIALYNKSLTTATHQRLMYLWNLMATYAMKESSVNPKWVVIVDTNRELKVLHPKVLKNINTSVNE